MREPPPILSNETTSAVETDTPDISGSHVGTITHRLIARCAEFYGSTPTPAQILEVGESVVVDASIVRRQVLRLNSTTFAASYFREFALVPSTFLGSEVWVGGVPVDLLWRWNGVIWIDEIKTGLTPGLGGRQGLEVQVQDQWEQGVSEFGSDFGGVRAILISRPKGSFHLDSQGRLFEGMPR